MKRLITIVSMALFCGCYWLADKAQLAPSIAMMMGAFMGIWTMAVFQAINLWGEDD